MLRRLLVAASHDERLRRLAMGAAPARAVATRFVAGETLDDALAVVTRLNAAGRAVTLDLLGEQVDREAVADAAVETCREALRRIGDAGLDASVSVKPSQLGVALSVGRCAERVGEIATAARAVGTHVTVDMEGSDLTQTTVDLVRGLRAAGHDNVGCAVQSYLRRTPADITTLTAVGASLRLCKGAYAEPEALALQDRGEIRQAYLAQAEQLLLSGTTARFATHDDWLVRRVRNLARRLDVADDAYEFQLLHGVREPLQDALVRAGLRVRVYVPFGDQWYPYLVRRLAERPANLAFFLRALVGKRSRLASGSASKPSRR